MAYGKKNNNNGGSFDLNKYETVKSRKVRLKNDHPNAFVLPFPLSDLTYASNYIMMGALIWKDKETFASLDEKILAEISKLPSTANQQNVGLVLASLAILSKADGAGHSLSIAGGSGADRNAWVENAEESAVGRALDNMGYHSGSASQEEMKKVMHMQEVQQARVQLENQIDAMYGALVAQGHNPQYLTQMTSQTVKPFNQLAELSVTELEKLLGGLQAISNQGAYQTNAQQAPVNQVPFVPGAPAPIR